MDLSIFIVSSKVHSSGRTTPGEKVLLYVVSSVKYVYGSGSVISAEEAISNILKNAFEASKSASDRKIALEIFNELNFVVINITDHGEGIDRHDLRHIFKPFFSTKTSGNNQGLGLAFTKKIINFHNGTIYVHSKKNCFTTFQIVLPLKSDTNKFFRRGNESYAF